MKRSKTCPKCASTQIYTDAGLSKRGDRSSIAISSWNKLFVDVYVCIDCGYIEEYASESASKDTNGLEKLKEHWRKHE